MDQNSLLNNDEVLYVRSGSVLMSNGTFKAREFLDALAQLVSEREDEWSDEQEGWFNERGLSCEALRFGNQGWQRGRVRIRMEFIPDDSPKLLREAPPAQRERPPYEDDIFKPRDSYPQRDPFRDPREGRDYPPERPGRGRDSGKDDYPEIYPDLDEY
jgi:KGK domain